MNTSTPSTARAARLLKDRKPYQEWVENLCKELEEQTNKILELETENATLEEQVQRTWQQNASLARERRAADARREDAEEELRRALAECERLRGLLDLSSDTDSDSDEDTQYDSAVESKQDSIPSPERKASPSPIKARTVLPSPPQSQARPPQPSVSTPSPVKTSSVLPSPPASQARPTVSPRSDNIFADFTFYFAEAVPRPVHTCIGPFDLETLGPALGLDSDMRRVVQGLSTACDLEARICNSADLVFFYHPVFVELGLRGEYKGTYFVDWGQASVNSRLEDRMLARQETPSHVFVQHPGVKERWFYYGARPLAVMNSETCNFWSQVLDGPSKDDILKHLGTRSKMGGVDIGQHIDTDHLVQISFEMGEEDVKATTEMKQKLKRAR